MHTNRLGYIRPARCIESSEKKGKIRSYFLSGAAKNRRKTIENNLISTINLLEAVRLCRNKLNLVIITSDKVYKNFDTNIPYKEDSKIGGDDPYSASKGMTELAIESYFKSFLSSKKNIKLAVARAGNVVGGGDWASHRIIPDIVRSWNKGDKVIIRSPKSVRPWQHVLEPLAGYLKLGEELYHNNKINGEAFNFGPKESNNYTVFNLLKNLSSHFEGLKWKFDNKLSDKKETKLLSLDSKKANKLLNWNAKLSFNHTIKFTADWYKNFYSNMKRENLYKFTIDQIDEYESIK